VGYNRSAFYLLLFAVPAGLLTYWLTYIASTSKSYSLIPSDALHITTWLQQAMPEFMFHVGSRVVV
jgi:hypothetical protein